MDGNLVVPTWDLFIIIFSCLIVAYSFIIGLNITMRMVISTYIAAFAADGLTSAIHRFFFDGTTMISQAELPTLDGASPYVIMGKIGIFLLMLVMLSAKGGFNARNAESGSAINFIYLLLFGTLSAALMLTVMLGFLAASSFIDLFHGIFVENPPEFAGYIYENSQIARYIVKYADIIFALPALSLIAAGLGRSEEE